MNAVQQQLTAFKERQRQRFQALQHECDLHERHLELFAERVDTPAWHEEAVLDPATAAAAEAAAVEVPPAHVAPVAARSSVRATGRE